MSLFLAAGCGQENISAAEAPAIDKQEIVFTSGGGEQTVVVTSSGEVSVVPADDWVTANVRAKSGNRTLVVFKAQMNQSPDTRETVAAVEAGNEKLSVRVRQEGVDLSGGTSGDLASQMNERFGIGWNLGNHFDAFNNGVSGETFWGNPKATRVTFTEVKAKGFSTVRIPVTWLGHIGDARNIRLTRLGLTGLPRL
jgi:endoglucanase